MTVPVTLGQPHQKAVLLKALLRSTNPPPVHKLVPPFDFVSATLLAFSVPRLLVRNLLPPSAPLSTVVLALRGPQLIILSLVLAFVVGWAWKLPLFTLLQFAYMGALVFSGCKAKSFHPTKVVIPTMDYSTRLSTIPIIRWQSTRTISRPFLQLIHRPRAPWAPRLCLSQVALA